jgi:hypothetical protein
MATTSKPSNGLAADIGLLPSANMFFFEKKNQKTFHPLRRARSGATAPMDESLFASFSSEKEESLS